MGNLSLWQWMLALILVFGFLVPALLAAWMIRRGPVGVRASPVPVLIPGERVDEAPHPRAVLRDAA
ncbi:MAG TPA: hypothetical protein VGC74_00960 [Stenotrophomonas sp.]|jgi:hypothetical protein